MKKRRILWNILKRTGADKILYGYLLTLAVIAAAIVIAEPDIHSFSDGLWYCYSVLTTIGFGDIVVTTLAGKVLSVILSVYSIIVLALIPEIITSFYMEIVRIRTNESMEKFMSDLERLPELSKDELEVLSERVKKFHKKNK